VESYVGGHWVPFDPTNRHFASLPANHLVLYRGDEALFRHTSDVNFDYVLVTTSTLVPSPRIKEALTSFNVWSLFERLKLPFSLLRTVLMLPVGALVVVLFRNVVGMPTFGTFLPALIAAAAGETGLFWGIVSIVVVTLMTVAARSAIASLRLLHSPTLAILLAVVVLTMLGTSLVADRLGLDSLARVSYFPIAVLAIASERFYLAMAEQGTRSAVKQLTGTLLVVLGCYVVMNSIVMQALVSSFPELLLMVIAANIYLGKWIGVRLSELWRFRSLIAQRALV
jgi:7 transmembrane helices usually fused to an inactive transglutaminase